MPPSGLAASTMPFDSMPISFAGLRFATMATCRPTSASASYASAMPATSVRCSWPRSTCELHQPLRVRHALGAGHPRDAQVDLHEVVDRDPVVGRRRGRAAGGRRRPARERRWRRETGVSDTTNLLLLPVRRLPDSLVSRRGHMASRRCSRRSPSRRTTASPSSRSAAIVSTRPPGRESPPRTAGITGAAERPRRAALRPPTRTPRRAAPDSACFASTHGSLDAMNSLVASTMRNA